jgi:hypothetical protein
MKSGIESTRTRHSIQCPGACSCAARGARAGSSSRVAMNAITRFISVALAQSQNQPAAW